MNKQARTMQFRHFATEEIGKEPYFFAPKEEIQTAQNVINPPTPLAKTAKKTAVLSAVPTDNVDTEGLLLQTHEALFYKKVGDGYAAFAATPQGEVAASKSGVSGEEEGNDLICNFESNGIYVCGINTFANKKGGQSVKPYNYLLTSKIINDGIPQAGAKFNAALKRCYDTELGRNLFDKYINGDGITDSYSLGYDDGTVKIKSLQHSTVIFIVYQTLDESTGAAGSTQTYNQLADNFGSGERIRQVDGNSLKLDFTNIKYKHLIHTVLIFDKSQKSSYRDLTDEQNYADTIYHEFKYHIDFDIKGMLGADITHTIAGWGRRFNQMRVFNPKNPSENSPIGLLDFPNKNTTEGLLKDSNYKPFIGLDAKTVFATQNSSLPSIELLLRGSSMSNFDKIEPLLKKDYPSTFGKDFELHCKLAFAYDYFHDPINKTRLEDNGFTWEKIQNEGDFSFLQQVKGR